MTLATVLTMVLILGFVWGGFALALLTAVRKESEKGPVPRRSDLDSILILGSGPIVIGQACEFDYSGTQAVRALKEEGYRVVLVNSNPATIMTDPDLADRTYIEPLTPDWVQRVVEREKPDALLPTMGGQTALNLAMDLDRRGVLEEHGVELIGANARSIRMAEDREEFAAAMARIGLDLPHGGCARTMEEALAIIEDTGYPAIIRSSFTLGGTGGGIAYNVDEFKAIVARGWTPRPFRRSSSIAASSGGRSTSSRSYATPPTT